MDKTYGRTFALVTPHTWHRRATSCDETLPPQRHIPTLLWCAVKKSYFRPALAAFELHSAVSMHCSLVRTRGFASRTSSTMCGLPPPV